MELLINEIIMLSLAKKIQMLSHKGNNHISLCKWSQVISTVLVCLHIGSLNETINCG
jgi:hypothetical protein